MHHLAIMRKSWKLTEKILAGEKKIESRWYMSKRAPFNRINKGDIIYFKNSGDPVTLKAKVSDVKQFSSLTKEKVRKILQDYGGKGKICVRDVEKSFEMNKNKKYCILISLENPTCVRPFKVNKKGYGSMAAWICVNNIDDIKSKEGLVV
jgi:ASC-1-like (ASCH) protein